jgi:hypothetical protein
MFGTKSLKSLIVAGALALMASGAQAVTVDFDRITDNSSIDASSQLSLEVTDDGTRALFSFTVLAGAQSGASIAEIYFSDLLALFTPSPVIVTQTGVSYVSGSANPPDLPGGNNASPPFVVTDGLLADTANGRGGNANAIQNGDLLVLALNYSAGTTFQNLLDAMSGDAFRVGLHVRSLAGGESDSFVSDMSAVPVPAAGFLLLAALGGLGVASRRRRAV